MAVDHEKRPSTALTSGSPPAITSASGPRTRSAWQTTRPLRTSTPPPLWRATGSQASPSTTATAAPTRASSSAAGPLTTVKRRTGWPIASPSWSLDEATGHVSKGAGHELSVAVATWFHHDQHPRGLRSGRHGRTNTGRPSWPPPQAPRPAGRRTRYFDPGSTVSMWAAKADHRHGFAASRTANHLLRVAA